MLRYRDEFIQVSKRAFSEAIHRKRTQENACRLINEYYAVLAKELREESSIGSSLRFDLKDNAWSVSLGRSSLIVLFNSNYILVNVRDYGHGYEDKLTLEENGFYSKKFDQYLSGELLDEYLKAAFEKTLEQYK